MQSYMEERLVIRIIIFVKKEINTNIMIRFSFLDKKKLYKEKKIILIVNSSFVPIRIKNYSKLNFILLFIKSTFI